jgi:hypothetical protein
MLWRRVVIARPSCMREVQGRLNFSCCFVRCTKNIAKGFGDAVGIAVLNNKNINMCIYNIYH